MAELQSVLRALKNAHTAGDTAAAQKLARAAKSMGYGTQPSVDSMLADYEPTFGFGEQTGAFFKSIPRGALDMLETGAVGASAALPDEAEPAVRGGIESLFDTLGIPFEVEPDLAERVPAQFGKAVGSTLPFLATAAMGPAGVGAAVGMGTAAGAGEARIRAEQAGATPDEIAKATGLGMMPGATEVIAPLRILSRTLGRAPTLRIRDRLTRAARAGGDEGLQEAAAEVAQNLIAQNVYDPEQGAFAGTGESFGYGAGVGGLLQGLMDLAIPGRQRGAVDAATEDAEQALDAPAAAAPFNFEDGVPVDETTAPGVAAPVRAQVSPQEAEIDQALSDVPVEEPAAYVRQRTQPEAAPEVDPAITAMRQRRERNQSISRIENEFEQDRVTRAERAMRGESDQRELFPTPALTAPVVDRSTLRDLGVSPQAAVMRLIEGKNVDDPTQRQEIVAALTSYANNRFVKSNNPQAQRGVSELVAQLQEAPAPITPEVSPDQNELMLEPERSLELGTPVTAENAPGVAVDPDPVRGVPVTPENAPGVAADPELGMPEGVPVTPETAPGVAAPTAPLPNTEQIAEQAQAVKRTVDQTINTADAATLSRAFEAVGQPVPTNPEAAARGIADSAQRLELANQVRTARGEPAIELPEAIATQPSIIPGRGNRGVNQRLREKIQRGDKPMQLLDAIISDTAISKPLRDLARKLKRVSGDVDYRVVLEPMEGNDVGGFQRYVRRTDEMIIADNTNHDYAQTFLHEHVHALTAYAIDTNSAAGKKITKLYDQYKQAMGDADHYGLTDAHEFVAEALTNPVFQRAMRRYALPGQKKSLWRQFVDAIKSMLGIADADPVLDELLALTSDAGVALDQDVPNFIRAKVREYFENANGPQTPETAMAALEAQGVLNKRMAQPITAPAYKRTVRQLWENSKDATRRVTAYALPMPALNDLVRTKYGAKYPKFADAFNELTEVFKVSEGDTAQFIESIDPISKRISDFMQKYPERFEPFNELYFSGTTEKVDLTKPRSTYDGKSDKLAAYDRLKAGPWKEIGPEGQALYRMMRAIHNRQFTQLVDTVRSRMFATTRDAKLADEVARTFQQRMDSGNLEGYGALVRNQGKYLLRYRVDGVEEQGFERFENIEDRDARAEQLRNDPAIVPNTVSQFTSINKEIFEGVAPNSFVGGLLKTLQDANVPQELMDNVMEMAISVSPSNAIIDRIAKRKNTPGYIRDAFFAFRKAAVGMGSRINNMKNGAEVNAGLRKLQEAYNASGATPELATLYEEASERAKYASNPALAGWSNALKAAGYVWTLGANVSSAVVDLSSLALVTGPYLASQYGFTKTTAAMFKASKYLMGTGTRADIETMVTKGLEGPDLAAALKTMGITDRDVENMRTVPSLMNIDFNDPNLPADKQRLKPLVDAIRASGHSQRFAPLAEQIEQGAGNTVAKTIAYSGFLMNTSERIKREIGMLAQYNLELENVGAGANPTPEQMQKAAKTALDTSLLYNGGSTNLMGGRFQQQNLRSVLFMYKRFAVLMMYVQYRMLTQALRGADPATRAASRRQLAMTLAASALFAGARGMPLMGPLEDLWNLLADEEEGDDDFETAMRKTLGNGLTEGLPNALFNMNIGPRVELTRLMVRDTNLPEDATLADKMASHLGGPVFGSLNRIYRGLEHMQEGRMDRGIESVLPASISSLFKTLRFTTEGPTTLRGDPVTEITFGGGLAQALGFAPADYARAMDFTNRQRRVDRSLAARRTKLYERLYTSYRLNDTQGFQQALVEMNEFNQKHTERPDILFTPQKIKQSLTTRERNTQDMIMGALPATARRYEWMENAENYGF